MGKKRKTPASTTEPTCRTRVPSAAGAPMLVATAAAAAATDVGATDAEAATDGGAASPLDLDATPTVGAAVAGVTAVVNRPSRRSRSRSGPRASAAVAPIALAVATAPVKGGVAKARSSPPVPPPAGATRVSKRLAARLAARAAAAAEADAEGGGEDAPPPLTATRAGGGSRSGSRGSCPGGGVGSGFGRMSALLSTSTSAAAVPHATRRRSTERSAAEPARPARGQRRRRGAAAATAAGAAAGPAGVARVHPAPLSAVLSPLEAAVAELAAGLPPLTRVRQRAVGLYGSPHPYRCAFEGLNSLAAAQIEARRRQPGAAAAREAAIRSWNRVWPTEPSSPRAAPLPAVIPPPPAVEDDEGIDDEEVEDEEVEDDVDDDYVDDEYGGGWEQCQTEVLDEDKADNKEDQPVPKDGVALLGASPVLPPKSVPRMSPTPPWLGAVRGLNEVARSSLTRVRLRVVGVVVLGACVQ